MDDIYVKPGNQERGWNDPPQFSYGLQMARTPQRNLLNKRPTLPDTAAPPPAPHSGPSGPPPSGLAPPPAGRAPSWKTAERLRGDEDGGRSEGEPDVEAALEILRQALDACRRDVEPQVCNDVEKRLRLLEDSWKSGRLSLPVRRRVSALTRELRAGHWDRADEIHRSLMVDHVTEVSQWMVGVKRLIAETRKLRADACRS
ncbi:steroid receptor RNA activator 1 [Corythoichthys intestinalis]|uniref:steroid receptor RNA activator 1 n=1 Tax=Corythoichthys intestinalis TaxID=161448 RepID=UPI0025A5E108|nr:steroid receptor RNA activator 1 [Corythoichthys intestinalis]XP_061801121.1 steroid receptor RNA activator 1 [Nerophis lumbriciformis]